jgi:hypothetical protein
MGSLSRKLLAIALVAVARIASAQSAPVQNGAPQNGQVQNNQTNIYLTAPLPVAPPPPQYVVPLVVDREPPAGVGNMIAGAVLLPLGAAAIGTSFLFWFKSCDACLGSASALSIVGSALTITGAIELPVGLARMARHRRWLEEHGRPVAMNVGLGSLRLHF